MSAHLPGAPSPSIFLACHGGSVQSEARRCCTGIPPRSRRPQPTASRRARRLFGKLSQMTKVSTLVVYLEYGRELLSRVGQPGPRHANGDGDRSAQRPALAQQGPVASFTGRPLQVEHPLIQEKRWTDVPGTLPAPGSSSPRASANAPSSSSLRAGKQCRVRTERLAALHYEYTLRGP